MADDDLAERVRRAICGVELTDRDTICDIFEPEEIEQFVTAILEAIEGPAR